MKCRCVAILVFAFVLQLTNAAPPFDVDSFLDELLAMNTRMGDFILKAKYEYREISIGAAIVDNYLSSANALNSNNPITQSNGQGDESNRNDNKPQSTLDLAVEKPGKTESSFVGQTLDARGNERDASFGREKITDIEKVAEAQAQPYDQKNDQQNINSDGFSDLPAENAAPENVRENGKPDNSENAQRDNAKTENDNQIDNRQPDVDHEQDWGEETSNNESEDVDEAGWLDKTIDSIVKFFS